MNFAAFITILYSFTALASAADELTLQNKGLFESVVNGEFKNKDFPEPPRLAAKDNLARSGRVKGDFNAIVKPYGGRDLKGSSKGSYSSGGAYGPMSVCDSVLVYYEKKKFKESFLDIGAQAGGANADVPIYDAKTGRKIAEYTEVSIAYGQKDCYVNGVWTFDNNPQGRPNAQIFTTSSCYSVADAVTGGIGPFRCAQGLAKRVNRGPRSRQFFEINVCAGNCQ